MSITLKKENKCLNFFKGLACIFIVMLHSDFTAASGFFSYLGTFINVVSRFAVPLFFMVSGYFFFNTDKEAVRRKLSRKIQHVALILILSLIIYAIWYVLSACVIEQDKITFGAALRNIFDPTLILHFFLLNQVFVKIHLWFLVALLYCYLIMFLINKFNLYKYAYIYTVVAFVILFFLEYIMHFISNPVDFNYYARNAWLVGIPCFMTGHFIAENKEKVTKKITKKASLILIFGGLALSLAERLAFYGINRLLKIADTGYEVYIGSLIAAASMLIYSLHNEDKPLIAAVSKIGKDYSLDVYVIHYLFIEVLDLFIYKIGLSVNLAQAVRMLLAIIISVCASIVFRTILNYLKNQKQKNKAIE